MFLFCLALGFILSFTKAFEPLGVQQTRWFFGLLGASFAIPYPFIVRLSNSTHPKFAWLIPLAVFLLVAFAAPFGYCALAFLFASEGCGLGAGVVLVAGFLIGLFLSATLCLSVYGRLRRYP